ncbi:MAG: hypothetical protein IE933_05910, partial [Sphingomonadales bacterium]|nr:hypothetical protein [Sphingomonadales bacterium]
MSARRDETGASGDFLHQVDAGLRAAHIAAMPAGDAIAAATHFAHYFRPHAHP